MIATTNTMIVFAEYITAGPTIMRTALRSFVARDIRSPVRRAWKNESGRRWSAAKKSFLNLVLDLTRGADHDPPHQEPEQAADDRDRKDQRA